MLGGNPNACLEDFPDERGDLVIWVVVPPVDLAREQLTRFRGRGRLIRGRAHGFDAETGECNDVPCRRPEAVHALTSRGITRVAPHLCRATVKDESGEKREVVCPLMAECGYYAQFDGEGGAVYFLASEYLFVDVSADRLPRPDLVVIDETIIPQMAHLPRGVPVDRVLASAGPFESLARRIVDALEEPWGGEELDLDRNELRAACDALEPDPIAARPDMPVPEIVAAVDGRRPPEALRLFRRAMSWKAGVEVRDAYVDWHEDSRKLFMQWRRDPKIAGVPWVILDATAHEDLVPLLWPGARFERIDARRDATVVQVIGQVAGKGTLTDPKERGKSIRRRIGWLLETLPPNGLLITHKDAEGEIGRPASWRSAHFGNFRGQDWAKDAEVVVVVGRPMPAPWDVERLARALFWDRPEVPLSLWSDVMIQRRFGPHYERERIGFLSRDEDPPAGVRALRHQDPVVEALRLTICEAEVEQAIDRVRAVRAEKSKLVILINEAPIPVPVDALVAWEDLTGGLRTRVAFARLGGFLPSDATWLAARFADLWSSAKAAKEDVSRYREPEVVRLIGVGPVPAGFDDRDGAGIGDMPVWEFRVEGQRGRARRVRSPHPEDVVRAWLAENFGPVAVLTRATG